MNLQTPHLQHLPRQTGSAGTVNIYFFLTIMALFLGVIGFAYHLFANNQKMEGEIRELNAEARQLERLQLLQDHYLEDLGAAVGATSEYSGREGIAAERYAGKLEGVVTASALRSRTDTFATQTGITNMSRLSNLFWAVAGAVEGLQSERDAMDASASVAESMKSNAEATASRASSQYSQELRDLNGVVSADSSLFASVNATRQATAAALTSEVQDVATKVSTAKEERLNEVRSLTEAANRLIGHTTSAVEKLRVRESFHGPDGKVLADAAGLDTVVINLGRKDDLVDGVVFRIREPNGSAVKAYGTVTSVDQETARLKIHGLVDPRVPVVRGDLLFHELYTPNVRRHIYLMGRFGYPYDRARIAEQLTALGNRVSEEFKPGVDLVVLGQSVLNEEGDGFTPVESTDEYTQALTLGVEFIKLEDVRDLLRSN